MRTLTVSEYRQAKAALNEIERIMDGTPWWSSGWAFRIWVFFWVHRFWLKHVEVVGD